MELAGGALAVLSLQGSTSICVQRDARRSGGDSHFCVGVISTADILGEGWVGMFQGVKWTMAGNLKAKGEMQIVRCPLF